MSSRRPIAQIALELGVDREALWNWLRQAERDQGQGRGGLTTDEREELKTLRKENVELRRANEILKSASAFFLQRSSTGPGRGDPLHRRAQGSLWVEPVCRVLGVPASTYYARKTRPPSRRSREDEELLRRIRRVHAASYGVYGARKVWRALGRESIRVGRGRVERLMHAAGIEGVRRGKRRFLTKADLGAVCPADLVDRDFSATRPNQLWVADLTYVRTWEGFVYLAVVLAVFSRRIVGW